MGKVLRYLLQNFTLTFLSLFGTLFFVISIIFFIKISSITAVVKIDFIELGKLYLFMLPRILLFTLPLSFFIALSLSLFRLSKENESIVLFTLGYNPLYIAKFFTLMAFLLSVFLLINSLLIVPLADQLNTNFLDFKKNEAQFNINPSESGQSFSNWFLIAGSVEDKNGTRNYHNIALYSPADDGSEHFVLSKNAKILNNEGTLNLLLKQGYAYKISHENINEAQYSSMIIRTTVKSKLREVSSMIKYWMDAKINKKRARNFALYVLISLFPLATVLFAPSFGIVTYRYNNGEIYGALFVVIFCYFILTMALVKYYPLLSIFIIFTFFFLLSIKFFQKMIIEHF